MRGGGRERRGGGEEIEEEEEKEEGDKGSEGKRKPGGRNLNLKMRLTLMLPSILLGRLCIILLLAWVRMRRREREKKRERGTGECWVGERREQRGEAGVVGEGRGSTFSVRERMRSSSFICGLEGETGTDGTDEKEPKEGTELREENGDVDVEVDGVDAEEGEEEVAMVREGLRISGEVKEGRRGEKKNGGRKKKEKNP